jgi:hypothetical protein
MVLDNMRSTKSPLREIKEEFSRFESGSGEMSAVELKRGFKNLQV